MCFWLVIYHIANLMTSFYALTQLSGLCGVYRAGVGRVRCRLSSKRYLTAGIIAAGQLDTQPGFGLRLELLKSKYSKSSANHEEAVCQ
jgi:hypothetical protein